MSASNKIWLVQNNLGQSFSKFYDILRERGENVENISESNIDKFTNLDVIRSGADFVYYGSIELCKKLQNEGLKVGPTWENYNCSAYYPYLGKFLLNEDCVFIPLKELKRRLYFFYGILGRDAKLFIRPNRGDKSFKACVVDLQDFNQFYSQVENAHNELVVISSPKNIRGEWRFVVIDGEIVSSSLYIYQGLRTELAATPTKAVNLANEILTCGYSPDKMFTIDVCEDILGEYRVMELNSFNCAGLYACDLNKVIEEINRSTTSS